ncbi:MAG TPA: hypothetical protein PK263_05590 [bacterium]|nr:hypothetical protein [bacterium]
MADDNNSRSEGVGVATPPAPTFLGNKSDEEDIIRFDTNDKKTSPAAILLVCCAIIAIAATVFFWMMKRDAVNKADIAGTKLSELEAQLASSELAATDQQAKNFKASVGALQIAEAQRYKMGAFLPELYKKVNKNVRFVNISVDNLGKISIDAVTSNYKAAGEQAMTLKEWQVGSDNVLKDIEIAAISEKIEEGVVSVPFTLSSTLNKTVKFSNN